MFRKIKLLAPVLLGLIFLFLAKGSVAENTITQNLCGDPTFCLVKTADLSTVYYIAADGIRRPFLDSLSYFSWYKDFSEVKVISLEEMQKYAFGKPKYYKPGNLVKLKSVPKVFMVEQENILHWIRTEEDFNRLGFHFSDVKDLEEAFYFHYIVKEPLTQADIDRIIGLRNGDSANANTNTNINTGGGSNTVGGSRCSASFYLNSLSISVGSLNEVFDEQTYSYTSTVDYNDEITTVTATTTNSCAAISVNGGVASPGVASAPISLTFGADTVITIAVFNDVSVKNYTITVTRPTLAVNLSNITLSAGSLNETFAANTTSYTSLITYGTASTTVTPTTAIPEATITVNGSAVTSGSPSSAISLTAGQDHTVTVVASLYGTTKTYTITVTAADLYASMSNAYYDSSDGTYELNSDESSMVVFKDFGTDYNSAEYRTEAWDVQVYNNKLYVAVSDDFMLVNSGWVYEFDGTNWTEVLDVTSTDGDAASISTEKEEGLQRMEVIGDKLYICGGDADNDTQGSVYIYDTVTNPASPSLTSLDLTSSYTDHVVDIGQYTDAGGTGLYITVGRSKGGDAAIDGATAIYRSYDNGSTWDFANGEYYPYFWGFGRIINFNNNIYFSQGGYLSNVNYPAALAGYSESKLVKYDGSTWSFLDYDPPSHDGNSKPVLGTSYTYDRYYSKPLYEGMFSGIGANGYGTTDRVNTSETFNGDLYFGTGADIYKFNATTELATSVLQTDKNVMGMTTHKNKLYAAVAEEFNFVNPDNLPSPFPTGLDNDDDCSGAACINLYGATDPQFYQDYTHEPNADSRNSTAWKPWNFWQNQAYTDYVADAQIWSSADGTAWSRVTAGADEYDINADAVNDVASFNNRLYASTADDDAAGANTGHAKLWVAPYYSAGNVVSFPGVKAANVDYNTFTWSATTNADTTVKFQFRTATTKAGLNSEDFVGPDGTTGTYYVSTGEAIPAGHDGERWYQYKTYFETVDVTNDTPSLSSVTITTN